MEMNEKTEKDLSKRLKQGDYQALKAISESYFAERPERLFSNEQYEEKGIYI